MKGPPVAVAGEFWKATPICGMDWVPPTAIWPVKLPTLRVHWDEWKVQEVFMKTASQVVWMAPYS
jgi:hypothetical protein